MRSKLEIYWRYHFSNAVNSTSVSQYDNNGTEPEILANTHVYENEGFDASQHDVTATGDHSTYVTHPSHLQYDNLPPQQHVYEHVQ